LWGPALGAPLGADDVWQQAMNLAGDRSTEQDGQSMVVAMAAV
jgi:hypothetical protein